jgi:thiosulfate sulfurtransferase
MNFQVIYPKNIDETVRKEHALLLDLRPREVYEREHWPGARNYPYEKEELWERLLPKNRLVILYCQHGGSSMQLASRLGNEGYRMASVVGGYEAMKKYAKSPFQNGKNV